MVKVKRDTTSKEYKEAKKGHEAYGSKKEGRGVPELLHRARQ